MMRAIERRPPGPRGVPILGNTWGAWRDPIGLMLAATREHGDIVEFRFGPIRYLLLNDPAAVHYVLVENQKNYTKSRTYRGVKLVLGEGLLTSDGDHWRRQRKLAQPAFHRDRLGGFARTMVEHTDDMLRDWERTPADQAFDMHSEMTQLTLRIAGQTLFGADVGPQGTEFGDAVTEVNEYVNEFATSVLRAPAWVPTARNLRFRRSMAILDGLVLRIIEQRRRSGRMGDDLLGMFMSARGEDGREAMNDEQLRDEVMTSILAGHETTANLLSWTFHLLAGHPEVEQKVTTEIATLGDRPLGLPDLPHLGYTKQVLEETLRIYPPAWTFEREAIAPDTIAGYPIKSGVITVISPYVMHRHRAYWPSPETFDPSRFAPDRATDRPRFSYLPFGGGPRQCIGGHFAMMEAQLVTAMILRRYHLRSAPGRTVEQDPKVSLRPKNGIWMIRSARGR